jgi:ABC-type phosphate transport system substrate-binding protein
MSKVTVMTSLLFSLMMFANANAEVIVVCNSAYDGDLLSVEQIREIYLGKSKKFPNGSPVKPIDQGGGSGARNQFLELVMEKNESQMNRYWSRLIFSGKSRPPEVLESGEAVKRWVVQNPNGIGYIDAGDLDDSVKILLRVQ